VTTVFVLTDFGLSDTYCGQMKAAFLSVLPDTAFVDLTASVRPGDIAGGAFHLMVSSPWIPAGAGVLAVVDPGVGTARRGLLCRRSGVLYSGPDNGLLGWVGAGEFRELPAPPAGSSATFHGRDVFAPWLARAMKDPAVVSSLPQVDPATIEVLDRPAPSREGRFLSAVVASVDSFGNCILWLSRSHLEGVRPISAATPAGVFPVDTARAYDRPGLLLLPGGSGLLELAVAGGSAADLTGLGPGDGITLELEPRA